MVKTRGVLHADEARGSYSGITIGRSRYGQYVRARATPVQPRTSITQRNRYYNAQMNSLFVHMSVAAIQSWNDFGNNNPVTDSLGQSINLTGLNWCIGLNTRLKIGNCTLIGLPPLNPSPEINPTFYIFQNVSVDGAIQLTWDEDPVTNQRYWVSFTPELLQSCNFRKGSMRTQVIFDDSDSSPQTLIPYSSLRFPGESKIQFEVMAVDEYGRATVKQRFDVNTQVYTP